MPDERPGRLTGDGPVRCVTEPVAGIDERVLLGGSLAHEAGYFWQTATQA